MEYTQLNADGSYSHQITTQGNVEWDSTHFCPASALTPDEAMQFRVLPLAVTEPPPFNQATQVVVRDGGELVAGVWQYKWRIDNLTTAQIAARLESQRLAAIPVSISPRQLRQALSRTALRVSVEAVVAASDQDTKDWYAWATAFERHHPRVVAMGVALGQTSRQLDDLFTLGSSL